MKLLFENWRKYLTEGKMKYSVSNTGWGNQYQFFDESGEQADQSLGMMVLDLVDAGVGGWAPEEQIDRMMAVNADPRRNQGGMQRWDSNVFEDYYEADNQKILQAWAEMNNMELEQVGANDGGEYEDDGTNDFEEYYSESKKRNKVHESRMGDLHIEIQDALSEIMQQYGVGLEDIEGVIGDMKSDQGGGAMMEKKKKLSEVSSYEEIRRIADSGDYRARDMEYEVVDLMGAMQHVESEDAIQIMYDALDADGRDDEGFWQSMLSDGGNLMDALEGLKQTGDEEYQPDSVEEAISPEQQEANEKAYSRCFEMGKKGMSVHDARRSVPAADFKACMAGHEDGSNEFRQSLPSEHDLQERIKKAVIRKLRERKK